MKRSLFALLSFVLLAETTPVSAGQYGAFTYSTDGVAITITGYSGLGGDVAIPDAIEGLPVGGIGERAFWGCSSLTSVAVPDGVASLGSAAFGFCKGLTNITIPSGVTNLGEFVFYVCSSLSSVEIPKSVTSIGVGVFASCTSLADITIPDSVTNIGERAFVYCTNLTSITIPDSVTSIGAQAFDSCTSLTSVTIPSSVTSIGWFAFLGCTNLTSITIDAQNPAYSSVDGALLDKSQTTLIQYPAGKASSDYTVPNSVTSIGDGAFTSCANLTSVTIPDSVTSFMGTEFCGCTRLSTITVDALNPAYSSVDGVLFDKGTNTLIRCPEGKVGSYTIPNNVTNIGVTAFLSCASLSTIIIPSSLAIIGVGGFSCCGGLTAVYFQGNAPAVGWDVFSGASPTVYYLPGTTGWGTTFGGRPTAIWQPEVQTADGSFGVLTNQFGFTTSWASGQTIVVEASTELPDAVWIPLETNTLTSSLLYFSDPDWTNQPTRFYRIRSP